MEGSEQGVQGLDAGRSTVVLGRRRCRRQEGRQSIAGARGVLVRSPLGVGWAGWWRAGVQVTGHLKLKRKTEKLHGRKLEAEITIGTVPGVPGLCMIAVQNQQ